jgi:uncharacterized protein
MTEDLRSSLVATWFEKAGSALQDAILLNENGRWAACVNRLYYAVFYAANAVLASRGQTYAKHSAVRGAMHRDFVNTGLLDKEFGRIYDILLSRREQADYRPAVTFGPDEVGDYLIRARQFVDASKRLAEAGADTSQA